MVYRDGEGVEKEEAAGRGCADGGWTTTIARLEQNNGGVINESEV